MFLHIEEEKKQQHPISPKECEEDLQKEHKRAETSRYFHDDSRRRNKGRSGVEMTDAG